MNRKSETDPDIINSSRIWIGRVRRVGFCGLFQKMDMLLLIMIIIVIVCFVGVCECKEINITVQKR